MPKYKVTVTKKGELPMVLEDIIEAPGPQAAENAARAALVLIHQMKPSDCEFKVEGV